MVFFLTVGCEHGRKVRVLHHSSQLLCINLVQIVQSVIVLLLVILFL